MSRAGRKRKQRVERYPSGDPKPVKIDARAIAMLQPHRRSVEIELRHAQEAGTAIGRLYLREMIDWDQYNAGCVFAAVVNRYRAIICAPNPDPGAWPLEGASRSKGEEMDPDEAYDRKERYDLAHDALMRRCGRAALMIVNSVCIQGRDPPAAWVSQLKSGLSTLSVALGLTGRRKS